MPADISIRRLSGLSTFSPNSEGEITDLIQADNVMFNRDGLVSTRPGLHFFTNTPVGDNRCAYVGRDGLFLERLFGSENGFYTWTGGKTVPGLTQVGIRTVTSGSRTTNVVTLVVPAGHFIAGGHKVIVNVADATYNGIFTVTSVTATTIVYSQVAADDIASGAGTVAHVPINLQDVGVFYNAKLYLQDGRNYVGGLGFAATAGQPSSFNACMTIHAERMWFLDRGSGSSRLRFSEPGNPESWPAANFIDISPEDGTFPSDLKSFQNRLYIFKGREMWVLETPGVPTTWILRRFAYIGCDEGICTEYDGALYWSAITGAYRFDGSSIEKISDPIQDIYDSRTDIDVVSFANGPIYSAVFRDQWVFHMEVGQDSRYFCYQTKLGLWSEWTIPYQSINPNNGEGVYPISLWSEPEDEASVRAGLYMSFRNDTLSPLHGFIVGTELGVNDFWADETGTRTGTPTVTEHTFSPVIQTKYSDFGDAYNKKRITDWMIENEGGDVLVDQIDERQQSVNKTVLGSTAIGVVHQNKIRGIGYFKRLSIKLTLSNFRTTGFKLYGLYGRMKVRGQTVADAEQVTS